MKKLVLWLLIFLLPCAALADQTTLAFPEGTDNLLIFREDENSQLRLDSYWIQAGDRQAKEQSYTILPNVILGGSPWYIDGSRPAYWCSHPLQGDAGLMDQLDLQQLPLTFDELIAQADTSDWATVSSEQWFLTRSLYAEPRVGAAILGEYFSTTPARILEDAGTWLRVSLWGREGWMQRKCLAFGMDMLEEEFRSIDEISLHSDVPVPLYAQPGDSQPLLLIQPEDRLITNFCLYIWGFIGDDWLHVATYDGTTVGYIPRDFLNPGNG